MSLFPNVPFPKCHFPRMSHPHNVLHTSNEYPSISASHQKVKKDNKKTYAVFVAMIVLDLVALEQE